MHSIWAGIFSALSLTGIGVVFLGTTWGIIAGALPGVTASMGMALILPFVLGMEPAHAFMILAGAYVGAEYGGSIPAILIGTPGQPANAPTSMDGHQMHLNGHSGKALGYSLTAGAFGSFLGGIIAISLLVVLSKIALLFGPADFFALAIFGLSAVVSMSKGSFIKGFMSVILGLMLGTVGSDTLTGMTRYAFGSHNLAEGLGEVPVIIGLVAASEIIDQVVKQVQSKKAKSEMLGKLDYTFITLKEAFASWKAAVFSTVLGIVVGVMPGAGPTIASFIAYSESRRFSKDADKYGTGVPDAIVGPEAANNACVPATFVPLLTFGIPGSTSAAILLGAMIMHGMRPGPMLATTNPEILSSLYAGIIVSAIALYIVGRVFLKPWVKITSVPPPYLFSSVLCLMTVGALALNSGMYPVWLLIIFGVVGYLLKFTGFNPICTVLGFVLESMIETNMRRALLLSKGSYLAFVTSPISLVLLLLTAVSIYLGMRRNKKDDKKAQAVAESAPQK